MSCQYGVCTLRSIPKSSDPLVLPSEGVWTVYGADRCIWCRKAKELLEMNGIQFVYVDVEKYDKTYVFEVLFPFILDHKTIPVIFNGTKFIEGYNDLVQHFVNLL